jgi:thiol-disulfide isomerase/thioredoxin
MSLEVSASMTNVQEKQSIGCLMADFALPLLDGNSLALQSLLVRYQAVVVVFWSGLCAHCRRYDDYLNRLSERYPGLGLLAVASRQNESAQMLCAAVVERGLRFLLVHDAERAVADAWLVSQTPRVFLLDPARRLIYRGALDNFKYPADPDYVGYLNAAIEAFLAGQTPPRVDTSSFGCPVKSVYYALPKP